MSIPAPFDPLHALRVLNSHGVRYLVIGGVAANVLGSPTITTDLDICYARDDTNLRALAEALVELHARLRGAPEGLPFLLDHVTIRNGDSFTFTTAAGDVDILGIPRGTDGFEQLVRDASRVQLSDDVVALVASLEQLMRMKAAAGRQKDLINLEILAALREEIEES